MICVEYKIRCDANHKNKFASDLGAGTNKAEQKPRWLPRAVQATGQRSAAEADPRRRRSLGSGSGSEATHEIEEWAKKGGEKVARDCGVRQGSPTSN